MKNMKFSLPSVIALVLLVLVLGYAFLGFLPAQNSLAVIRAETAAYQAEAALYAQYIDDTTELDDRIAAIQAEIDAMNATAYTNESTVSLVISDAIQRYNVQLTSIQLEEATTVETHRALPIQLSVAGSMEDIIAFMDHFEQNTDGSYLVHAAAMEVNGDTCKASIVIYLCTPAEEAEAAEEAA